MIKDSKHYNRTLFEQSHIGLALCRMNGELVDINLAYAQIIGRSIEETLQLSYWDITPESYAEDEQLQLESLNTTGRYGPYEKEYIHKDGHLVPVRLQGSIIEIDGEKYIWSSVDDITEHQHLVQILESLAGSGTSEADFDDFLCNALRHLTTFYGVKFGFVGQLLPGGTRVRTLAVLADGQLVKNFEYDLQGTPCQDILDLKMELIPHSASTLYSKDLMLIDMGIESYFGAPMRDVKGNIQGLIAVMDTRPMTISSWSAPLLSVFSSRITSELERREAEEREISLGRILDNSLNEIYIFDADTLLFIQVNQGAIENLGYSMEELQKLTPQDLNGDHSPTSFIKLLTPLHNGDKNKIQFNTDYRRKDGSTYPIEAHLQLSTYKSTRVFVMFVLDITKRQKAEEALRRSQKMEAIGQLSGGIAHDFNNQLGIMIGYLDLLKDQYPKGEKPLKWVNTATQAALRCMDLTRQLLSFSRKQSHNITTVDLNASIKDMEIIINRTVTPEVEVQYCFCDNLWLTEINSGEFKDAILNLVLNARDAMPGGGKLIIETSNVHFDADHAEINPEMGTGDYVELMLNDTGSGMDKETLEHIFEPFFTTKVEDKGTGLGMSMVYGFTKRYGGYIRAYSDLGAGATIRLYLPRSTASKSSITTALNVESELPRGNESILIVDDEVDLLQLADKNLRSLGYHTHLAKTGAQAMEILEKEKGIELLFSDVVMPGGMNGYELAQQATQLRPGLRVLLTSGFTPKATNNGPTEYNNHLLEKPYRRGELAQYIRTVLDENKGH